MSRSVPGTVRTNRRVLRSRGNPALFNDTGSKLDETVGLKLNRSARVVSRSVIRVCAGLSEPHPRKTDGFEGECQHTAHNPP